MKGLSSDKGGESNQRKQRLGKHYQRERQRFDALGVEGVGGEGGALRENKLV